MILCIVWLVVVVFLYWDNLVSVGIFVWENYVVGLGFYFWLDDKLVLIF